MAKRKINSRRKGHQYERDVAALYREAGFTAKRGLQSRGGGMEVADVVLEEVDWFIECKNTVRMSKALTKALERADEEAKGYPTVVHIKMPQQRRNKVVVEEGLWAQMIYYFQRWLNAKG